MIIKAFIKPVASVVIWADGLAARLTSEQVQRALAKASFAVAITVGVVRRRSARVCRMTPGVG